MKDWCHRDGEDGAAAERTAPPLGARSTAREVLAGYHLGGRDAVVTGGASGIGFEAARALATAGARVIIADRDVSLGVSAASSLSKSTGGEVEFGLLDLASLASVRAFADWYLARRRALHCLINNAAVMAVPRSLTADGFESQFGVNHLGHFALTLALMRALKAAHGARVVSVTSLGHCFSDIDCDDPHFARRPYDKWLAYGRSKTANALFAVALAERRAGDGVTAFAAATGGVLTGLQRHLSREEQVGMGFFDESGGRHPAFKSAEQGAATLVWAAVAPELEGRGGRYLEDCAVAKPLPGDNPERGCLSGYMPYALDSERARRLWSLSETLAKVR